MATQDIERFEKIILPHLDDAYTLARYLLRDEHDAQDAVQDAVLRALRYFDGYRSGDARAWLLAIVRNCCLTWRQRRQTEGTPVAFTDEVDASLDASEPTDRRAIEGSNRAAVRRVVASLPTEYREVIVLRELEGLSYREISDVVGVPIGTVMSRLARARKRLAAGLGFGAREAS